ncbi:MAG: PIN domain-containing protein [Vicinamibacterales bacterium]
MALLVDTSAWVETLRPDGDAAVRARVESATRDGEAALCEMVLLELWMGAAGERERAVLEGLAADLQVLPIDAKVWRRAHEWARACRDAGVTVPATDVLIAACASVHHVDILARDKHFDQIARVVGKRKGK